MGNFSQPKVTELFEEAWGNWPASLKQKDDKALAYTVFSQFVTNSDWLDAFLNSLGNVPSVPFSSFIKNLAKKYDKPLVSPRVASFTKIISCDISQDKVSPRVQEVFKEVRAAWPENKDHGEPYGVAQVAFEIACKERDVEELREACLAYSEAWYSGDITYKNPFWLKNFLTKEGLLDEWLHKNKSNPNPEELKVFEVCWYWYPTFNGKEKEKVKEDSFAYWCRIVKKEDLFDFLIAVKAYRKERQDKAEEDEDEDQGQFNKGFLRFTKEWREQTSFIASTTASMVCREILWVCKEYGFDKEELWKAEMNAHIQGIQKFGRLNLEKTVQYCLNALIGLSNSKDCPEKDEFIVKQVISKAWERALQLPEKGVVLESL